VPEGDRSGWYSEEDFVRVMPILLAAAALACGSAASTAMVDTQITGAGSTFDYPFFSKAFHAYSEAHPDVTISYEAIGSAGGILQFSARAVDFAASDVPMDTAELAWTKDPVLQVPVTLGGVGIAYNIPGIAKGLRLTREVVADIYLGKITEWNDPSITGLNSSVKLPAMPITVVHRSDGSGTTYIFTDFLSHVSPAWKQNVGKGKSVIWPVRSSAGGQGNEGVTALVRRIPGAIGYVELAYLLQNDMTYALLQNKAGKYLYPNISTVAAAAATHANLTTTDFSIVDAAGPDCYPISGYSWVLLYKTPNDRQRGALVKQIINWLVTEGQPIAKGFEYVPLPDNVQLQAMKVLDQMQVK
jgi:phosphate transport system substrate-binding protein